MFSPASLIELSVVKVLTPCHSGFQGQHLLHSSGQEMRVSSKLELKITKKSTKTILKGTQVNTMSQIEEKENKTYISYYGLPIISTIFLHYVLLNRKQITLQADSHLSSCRCYELLYAALFTIQGGITGEKYHQRRRQHRAINCLYIEYNVYTV